MTDIQSQLEQLQTKNLIIYDKNVFVNVLKKANQ